MIFDADVPLDVWCSRFLVKRVRKRLRSWLTSSEVYLWKAVKLSRNVKWSEIIIKNLDKFITPQEVIRAIYNEASCRQFEISLVRSNRDLPVSCAQYGSDVVDVRKMQQFGKKMME